MSDPHEIAGIEAERCLLGAALGAVSTADNLLRELREEAFSQPVHRAIWRAVTVLRGESKDTGVLSVLEELTRTGDIRNLGDPTYLSRCVDTALANPGDAGWYLRIVQRGAHQRRLNMLAGKLSESARISDDELRLANVREIHDHLGNGVLTPFATPTDSRDRSWAPVDLSPYLVEGGLDPIEPEVGLRSDDRALLYKGRIHTWAGESEAGKSWLAVHCVLAEMRKGNTSVIVDFEDEPYGWIARLMAAGARPQELEVGLAYIRPEEPIGSLTSFARSLLGQAIHDLSPSFVLLDGTTDAMTLHGLNPLDNKDAAQFGRMLPRWIASQGPAVVASDHMAKGVDRSKGMPRYQMGAVHKLNGVDGASFIMDNKSPFGIGLTGRSTLYIAKDRPGYLRQYGRASQGLYWYADLVMISRDASFVELELEPPPEPRDVGTYRPTILMQRISDAMVRAREPLSQRGIEDRVKGNAKNIREALAFLVDDGYVQVEQTSRSKAHTLIRPYGDPPSDVEEGSDAVSGDGIEDENS
jgi:hypothetical protein